MFSKFQTLRMIVAQKHLKEAFEKRILSCDDLPDLSIPSNEEHHTQNVCQTYLDITDSVEKLFLAYIM